MHTSRLLTPTLYLDNSKVIKTILQNVEEGEEDNDEPGLKRRIFGDFLPKSHTCTNILKLPRGTHHLQIPSEDALFELYDFAFLSGYFGRR